VKRILLSLIGTIAGLVALLSFKTESHPLAATGGLPSAGTTPTTDSSSSGSSSSGSSSSGTSSASAAPTRTTTTARSYTGSAITTRYGIVQVKVTVAGGKITNVSFVQLTAFDGRSQQINSEAAPTLLQETLAAQSAQIDTVSGATYTTDGYVQSLQGALDQAGVK
jgi:uncharacterized protein with FMN-binding domain